MRFVELNPHFWEFRNGRFKVPCNLIEQFLTDPEEQLVSDGGTFKQIEMWLPCFWLSVMLGQFLCLEMLVPFLEVDTFLGVEEQPIGFKV